MDMRLDYDKIKHAREDRLWSQEQLAASADISLRTVQRAENGQSISYESVKAIAAAFGVDAQALMVAPEQLEHDAAIENVDASRVSAWIQLATYLFVVGLLVAINFASRPDDIWMTWPAIGWGIGVGAHVLAAFIASIAPKEAS